MGMSKDVNNLIKEFQGVIHVLQKGYHKYGVNHKLSKAKQGLANKNQKANAKFSDYWIKLTSWISEEMKK